jgi:hypothetical protein
VAALIAIGGDVTEAERLHDEIGGMLSGFYPAIEAVFRRR